MIKITFMGAGSTVFAKNVLGDCMLTPALRDAEIALYDIDAERLEESYLLITKLNENVNEGRATVKKYHDIPNRKDALRGADFVVVRHCLFHDFCTGRRRSAAAQFCAIPLLPRGSKRWQYRDLP